MAEEANNNKIEVTGEPLFEQAPYKVYVRADKSGYAVLNVDTGVFEVEDRVLGKCITFAEHSAAFLQEVAKESLAEDDSDLKIYPATTIPYGKLN